MPHALRALPVALFFCFVSHAIPASAQHTIEFVVGDYKSDEGGSWEAKNGPLRNPFGIDFDSTGMMYLVELGGNRVHQLSGVFDKSVDVQLLSRDDTKGYAGDGGDVASARFNGMHNCVVTRDDQLLISDSWNHCVRRIDLKSKKIDTIAGTGKAGFSGDNVPATKADFNFVMCIALSPDGKTMHIADLKNLRVRNVDLASGVVTTVAGNGKKGIPVDGAKAVESPLVDPRAVASDSDGKLYILERNGHALRVVRSDGTIHTVAGTGEKGFRDGDAGFSQFGSPKHICCDPDGNVYIADDENRAIRKYDPQSKTVTTLLGRGFGDDKIKLSHPHGVRWYKDELFVVDTGNDRVLRIR